MGAALAMLPVAVGPSWTPRLSTLIEAHLAARAAFNGAIDALEAADPEDEIVIPAFGGKSYEAADGYQDIAAHIEHDFIAELEKTATISALSPELGERAGDFLEARKAFCLAFFASPLRAG
jgi:hypothetical protein